MAELFLGLDTATEFLTLALWNAADGVVARSEERLQREHAQRVLPAIDALLKGVGSRPEDLSGIGVGVGPGSYTGLRIGLATASGLARALGVSLAGCDTLAAIAARGLGAGQTAVAVLEAGRGNVYAGSYRSEGATVRTATPPVKLARVALGEHFPNIPMVETLPPDAALIARRVSEGAPAEPVYL